MKNFGFEFSTCVALVLICFSLLAQPAAPVIEDIGMAPRLTIQSVAGTTNVIEYAEELETNRWRVLTNLVVADNTYVFVDFSAPPSPKRSYRVSVPGTTNVVPNKSAPSGVVLIPAGSFTMGDTSEGWVWSTNERPTHTVYVSAFYMDKTEVSKMLWDEVYTWAINHG
jgi:formylglycine-generating enzyme required for sulfatase activity